MLKSNFKGFVVPLSWFIVIPVIFQQLNKMIFQHWLQSLFCILVCVFGQEIGTVLELSSFVWEIPNAAYTTLKCHFLHYIGLEQSTIK